MRRSHILILATALLAVASPGSASVKWLTPAKASLGPKTSCETCHDGPKKTEAKGGKFVGPGAYLVERRNKDKKDIDIAWLKDYKAK